MYATELREGLAAAIDTDRLAAAWAALHPAALKGSQPHPLAGATALPSARAVPLLGGAVPDHSYPQPTSAQAHRPVGDRASVAKADPALAAFLQAARDAIVRVLQGILPRAWTEGWALGQQAALSLVRAQPVDWAAWTPGDHEAAALIAGPGLRQLLAAQGITIQSIADSRLEELAAVLEAALASDVTEVPALPAPLPPQLSVGSLARQLRDVLDNPGRAELVAHTEIARAQSEAARTVYRETGVGEVEVLTAEDDKVCPLCDAAEADGAHPVGSAPLVPLHPRCRCAETPVVAGAR